MSKVKRSQLPSASSAVLQSWNALTSPWLEVMDHHGQSSMVSPLAALSHANSIFRLIAPNPLDLFAAHRFLLTLLYWKAPKPGGVAALRPELKAGRVPAQLIAELASDERVFDLFDRESPFLQDSSVREAKVLSPAYLFAEMASGTNVAFFDHGDDATCRLCLRCAAQGLARLVPWTQSGGRGKQPSIHGAPPIVSLAMGQSLCQTLGLNLVPIDGFQGEPQWSGTFRPNADSAQVSVMEALTWNPRRVHLLDQHPATCCTRCGQSSLPTVGPIVYEKNEACKVPDEYTANWHDPAAFYRAKDGKSTKTTDEFDAALERDLRRLFIQKFGREIEEAPMASVVQNNPEHLDWLLVLPCNDPAGNKSFDHRLLAIHTWPDQPPASQTLWPKVPLFVGDRKSIDTTEEIRAETGALAFVKGATTLTAKAWAVVAAAANTSLEANVAAFDMFTSILWPLRNRAFALPSRQAAWMTLKLMATAPAALRTVGAGGPKSRPWSKLIRHQPKQRQRNGTMGAYPLQVPYDQRLEAALRDIIHRDHSGRPVDWAGVCQFIHNTLP